MIPRHPSPDVRLFSSDLEGTLVGNPAALSRFTETWDALPSAARPVLVYNTAMSVTATLALVRSRALPTPDYIIAGLGTELHDPRGQLGAAFAARLGGRWDLSAIDAIVSDISAAKKQGPENQNAYKSSWSWIRATQQELTAIIERVSGAGLHARVEYACRYFLDIVPANAGKGNGLAWLCERLGIPLQGVVVAGDTGQDASMFLLPQVRGIIVGNALAELRAAVLRGNHFSAEAEMADGVLEGLRHFGVIAAAPSSLRFPGALFA